MKNLKSYKVFESVEHLDKIKNDLQTMLYDFSDNGIEVEVTHTDRKNQDRERFIVRIGRVFSNYKPEYNFSPMSYKDEFLRLFSYMESEDYEFSSLSYYDHNGVVHSYNKYDHTPLWSLSLIGETTNLKIFFKQKLSQ